MNCKFILGQRVICVVKDDWQLFGSIQVIFPPYGSISKIVEMQPIIHEGGKTYTVTNGVWLMIEGYLGHWYTSTSFRPLKETETDISVFRKLLKPTKIKEDA